MVEITIKLQVQDSENIKPLLEACTPVMKELMDNKLKAIAESHISAGLPRTAQIETEFGRLFCQI